jgi:hypothetical protein
MFHRLVRWGADALDCFRSNVKSKAGPRQPSWRDAPELCRNSPITGPNRACITPNLPCTGGWQLANGISLICSFDTWRAKTKSQSTSCRNRIVRRAAREYRSAESSWEWSTQMTHMTRVCLIPVIAALGLAAAPAPASAQNAPQCVVSGSPPAGWGFNSVGYIEIASGSSCVFSVNITGEVTSSSVSQNPAHGNLQQLNVSSFVYTSEAGYRGSDTFSVQATGNSQTSSGNSVITINATLQ